MSYTHDVSYYVDFTTGKLYWVDALLKLISSCNFDGSSRRTISQSARIIRHPYDIAVYHEISE